MPQTVDFVYASSAALANQFVSLVSNKDGVTKFVATVASSALGQWTINPKPPAGTYSLYVGAAQGLLTTLVDPDYVVDPFDDQQNATFPGNVTVNGLLTANGPAAGNDFVVQANLLPILLLDVETAAATMRLQPPADAAALNSDGSIFSWFLQPFGEVNTAFADIKLSYDGAGNAVWHFLSDRTGNKVAAQIFTFEIDPRNQSNNAEFEVIRGSFRGGAGTRMFHVTQAVGIDAIEANTIKLGIGNFVIQTTAGDVVFQPVTSVRPFSDGNFDLGQAAFRWRNAYAVTSFAGTFDVPVAGAMGLGSVNATQVQVRGPQKSLVVGKALTALGAGAQTLTAAQLLGGEIEHTVTAAVADTTDTGANLDAAIPNVANGDTIECHLTILGAFTVTLTAGVGVTIKGTTALVGTAAGKTAHLVFRRTAASTWTCYVVLST